MKRFLKDTRGNASLWAAFLLAVLYLLAVVAYTGAILYSTYQTAQTELERAVNVSVDDSLINANVRDLHLDIPADAVVQKVYANLASVGYVQNAEGDWEHIKDGMTRYWLKGVQITVSGKTLDVTATLSMPLPWKVNRLLAVELPVSTHVNVLYMD